MLFLKLVDNISNNAWLCIPRSLDDRDQKNGCCSDRQIFLEYYTESSMFIFKFILTMSLCFLGWQGIILIFIYDFMILVTSTGNSPQEQKNVAHMAYNYHMIPIRMNLDSKGGNRYSKSVMRRKCSQNNKMLSK